MTTTLQHASHPHIVQHVRRYGLVAADRLVGTPLDHQHLPVGEGLQLARLMDTLQIYAAPNEPANGRNDHTLPPPHQLPGPECADEAQLVSFELGGEGPDGPRV